MAIWQQTYFVVAKTSDIPFSDDLSSLRAAFDAVLPRSVSWADDGELWGSCDTNTADVFSDGNAWEVCVRIDARSDWGPLLTGLWESVTRAGYYMRSGNSDARLSSVEEILADMQQSRAVVFSSDPWKALRDGARETAAKLAKEPDA
jgi:hypothetical protein